MVTTRKKTDDEEREALRISAGNQLKEMLKELKEMKEETNKRQLEERTNKRQENLRKIAEERRLYEKWAETHDMRQELTKYVECEKKHEEAEQRDAEPEEMRELTTLTRNQKSPKIRSDRELPG